MEAYLWFVSALESLGPVWSWLNTPLIVGSSIDGISTPLSIVSIGGIGAIFVIKVLKLFIG